MAGFPEIIQWDRARELTKESEGGVGIATSGETMSKLPALNSLALPLASCRCRAKFVWDPRNTVRIILPPLTWNKTTDGPNDVELILWLENYHRSLLPTETVFPRVGQIWEAIRDCEVGFEASFECPRPKFSKQRLADGSEVIMQEGSPVFEWGKDLPPFPWGPAKLAQGEQLQVIEAAEVSCQVGPKPLRASLQPLRYRELEASIVPQELCHARGYKGYRLIISTARPRWCVHPERAYLNEDFRLFADLV